MNNTTTSQHTEEDTVAVEVIEAGTAELYVLASVCVWPGRDEAYSLKGNTWGEFTLAGLASIAAKSSIARRALERAGE